MGSDFKNAVLQPPSIPEGWYNLGRNTEYINRAIKKRSKDQLTKVERDYIEHVKTAQKKFEKGKD